MSHENLPELRIVRHELDLTELWTPPTAAPTFRLRDSCTGAPSRLRTDVTVFRSDRDLYVLFSMDDDEVVASMYERDAPLWNEDVVEVFIAPERTDDYFELEVSPRGTLFDARIHFPGPDRSAMTVDQGWNCNGFFGAIRRVRMAGSHVADILVRIPFAPIAGRRPSPGDRWRANFFRIDRARSGDSYSAWSPTGTSTPDFHVPSRFGALVF